MCLHTKTSAAELNSKLSFRGVPTVCIGMDTSLPVVDDVASCEVGPHSLGNLLGPLVRPAASHRLHPLPRPPVGPRASADGRGLGHQPTPSISESAERAADQSSQVLKNKRFNMGLFLVTVACMPLNIQNSRAGKSNAKKVAYRFLNLYDTNIFLLETCTITNFRTFRMFRMLFTNFC